MYTKILEQEELTNFFLNDPSLCILGLADDYLQYLYEHKKYPMCEDSSYVGIFTENDDLISITKFEYFTEHVLNVHTYIASKMHKQKYSHEVKKILYNFFIENTNATRLLILSPEPCKSVQGAAKSFGMEIEGTIKKAITWRQQVVDIIIFAMDLIREDK